MLLRHPGIKYLVLQAAAARSEEQPKIILGLL
jgi:hypothetical protein